MALARHMACAGLRLGLPGYNWQTKTCPPVVGVLSSQGLYVTAHAPAHRCTSVQFCHSTWRAWLAGVNAPHAHTGCCRGSDSALIHAMSFKYRKPPAAALAHYDRLFHSAKIAPVEKYTPPSEEVALQAQEGKVLGSAAQVAAKLHLSAEAHQQKKDLIAAREARQAAILEARKFGKHHGPAPSFKDLGNWAPLNTSIAELHRLRAAFGGAKRELCPTRIRPEPIADAPPATAWLVINFMRNTVLCNLLAVVPLLVLAFVYGTGQRGGEMAGSAWWLQLGSIAQFNMDTLAAYKEGDACVGVGSSVCTAAAVSLPLVSAGTYQEADVVVAGIGLLVLLLLLGMGLALWWSTVNVSLKRSHTAPSISDYAVLVRNIPPGASISDIVQHFNILAGLAPGDDWRAHGGCCKSERPGFNSAAALTFTPDVAARSQRGALMQRVYVRPISGITNGNGWVAAVHLLPPVGDLIQACFDVDSAHAEYVDAMENMNKFRENSPWADPARHKQAEQDVLRLQPLVRAAAALVDDIAGAPRPATSAIVVFNSEESRLRVLEDYRGSDVAWCCRWTWKLREPKPLAFPSELLQRYAGRLPSRSIVGSPPVFTGQPELTSSPLRVSPLPPPQNLRWPLLQNCMPWEKRCLQGIAVAVIALVLIVGVFGQLGVVKVALDSAAAAPGQAFCQLDWPATVLRVSNTELQGARLVVNATACAHSAEPSVQVTWQQSKAVRQDDCAYGCLGSSTSISTQRVCSQQDWSSFPLGQGPASQLLSYSQADALSCVCRATPQTQWGTALGHICPRVAQPRDISWAPAVSALLAATCCGLVALASPLFQLWHTFSSGHADASHAKVLQWCWVLMCVIAPAGAWTSNPVIANLVIGWPDARLPAGEAWVYASWTMVICAALVASGLAVWAVCKACAERRARTVAEQAASNQDDLNARFLMHRFPAGLAGAAHMLLLCASVCAAHCAPVAAVLSILLQLGFHAICRWWIQRASSLPEPDTQFALSRVLPAPVYVALALAMWSAFWAFGDPRTLQASIIVPAANPSAAQQQYTNFLRDAKAWDAIGIAPRLLRLPGMIMLTVLGTCVLGLLGAWLSGRICTRVLAAFTCDRVGKGTRNACARRPERFLPAWTQPYLKPVYSGPKLTPKIDAASAHEGWAIEQEQLPGGAFREALARRAPPPQQFTMPWGNPWEVATHARLDTWQVAACTDGGGVLPTQRPEHARWFCIWLPALMGEPPATTPALSVLRPHAVSPLPELPPAEETASVLAVSRRHEIQLQHDHFRHAQDVLRSPVAHVLGAPAAWRLQHKLQLTTCTRCKARLGKLSAAAPGLRTPQLTPKLWTDAVWPAHPDDSEEEAEGGMHQPDGDYAL